MLLFSLFVQSGLVLSCCLVAVACEHVVVLQSVYPEYAVRHGQRYTDGIPRRMAGVADAGARGDQRGELVLAQPTPSARSTRSFGAAAGLVVVGWRLRNPRRTRAGASRRGWVTGFSRGRRQSSTMTRASRSWVWTVRISQVQRSAEAGSRNVGRVHPNVCLNSRKVCSRSHRRRNTCQSRSASSASASVTEDHNQTGLGSRSPGKCSTCRRITVPSTRGNSPSWSSQGPRRVNRGCDRFHA